MKTVIIALLALAFLPLAGCADGSLSGILSAVGVDPEKVRSYEDSALSTAVKPVPVYCNGLPQTRADFRERVNALPAMQGNKIGIWCEGDEPLTLGPDPAPAASPEPSASPGV